MGLLAKIEAFLKGKKTYFVALVAAGLAFYQSLGHPVPEYVYTLLAALGLGAVRSSIK